MKWGMDGGDGPHVLQVDLDSRQNGQTSFHTFSAMPKLMGINSNPSSLHIEHAVIGELCD
jgi:hypothetical protein